MKFMKVAGSEILYGGHIPTETFFFFFFSKSSFSVLVHLKD